MNLILAEAADRYGIDNPCANVKSLKVPKTQVDPFTLAEVQLILRTVRPDFHAYYTVRFFAGLRSAEIDGLKWQMERLLAEHISTNRDAQTGVVASPHNSNSTPHYKKEERRSV